MCKELKCQSWKIAVEGPSQTLEVETSATETQEVAKMTGAVVARWLESCNEEMRDGKIVWNADEGVARWSGWAWNLKDKKINGRDQSPKPATKSGKKTSQRKGKRKSEDDGKEAEGGDSVKGKRVRKA